MISLTRKFLFVVAIATPHSSLILSIARYHRAAQDS